MTENFTFGTLACVKSPFDLTIDFERDCANPEIYRGLQHTRCAECGVETFFPIGTVRAMDAVDFALLKQLCEECALYICGFEMVH